MDWTVDLDHGLVEMSEKGLGDPYTGTPVQQMNQCCKGPGLVVITRTGLGLDWSWTGLNFIVELSSCCWLQVASVVLLLLSVLGSLLHNKYSVRSD